MNMLQFCAALTAGAMLSLDAQSASAPGTLQPEFANALALDGSVTAITAQNDGKLLLAGSFKTASGLGRTNLVRLNSDGQVDAGFVPPADLVDPADPLNFHLLSSVAATPDGGILVGGYSTAQIVLATNTVGVKKLLPNGAIDSSFSASAAARHYVHALAVRPDGTFFTGDSNQHPAVGLPDDPALLWLDANGSPATNGTLPLISRFSLARPGTEPFAVMAFALQPDGSLLAGGSFGVGGAPLRGPSLMRLRPDGSLDANFQVPHISADESDGVSVTFRASQVRAIALQNDGKVVIGGVFRDIGVPKTVRIRLARLNADASLDSSFNPGLGVGQDSLYLAHHEEADKVNALAVQWDGKILVGGQFGSYHTNAAPNLARVNPDGSLDTTFQIGAGPNGPVRAIHILPDGDLLIAGDFTEFNGVPQRGIARLSSGMGPQLSIRSETDGSNRLQFHSTAGTTYTLQYKNSLEEALWQDAGAAAGNGLSLAFTNAVSGRAQIFYRLKTN